MSRKRRRRGPWFSIYGRIPSAGYALCATAHGKRDAVRKLSFLLENHPDVTFVEILRYQSASQTEQEIRDAVGCPPDGAGAPAKFGSAKGLLH
jgi:hypothetical protein